MDLGAYVQIESLEEVAKANGIEVARLRGYRLMKDVGPVTEEELEKIGHKRLKWNLLEYFSKVYNIYGRPISGMSHMFDAEEIPYLYNNGLPNWKKIHGRARKEVKFIIKQSKKEAVEQYRIWNKYTGREDVLYIHAKLGSTSWSDIKHYQYANKPWYIESIDDSFDKVYCDIYAKIDPETLKLIKTEEETTEDG